MSDKTSNSPNAGGAFLKTADHKSSVMVQARQYAGSHLHHCTTIKAAICHVNNEVKIAHAFIATLEPVADWSQ